MPKRKPRRRARRNYIHESIPDKDRPSTAELPRHSPSEPAVRKFKI